MINYCCFVAVHLLVITSSKKPRRKKLTFSGNLRIIMGSRGVRFAIFSVCCIAAGAVTAGKIPRQNAEVNMLDGRGDGVTPRHPDRMESHDPHGNPRNCSEDCAGTAGDQRVVESLKDKFGHFKVIRVPIKSLCPANQMYLPALGKCENVTESICPQFPSPTYYDPLRGRCVKRNPSKDTNTLVETTLSPAGEHNIRS